MDGMCRHAEPTVFLFYCEDRVPLKCWCPCGNVCGVTSQKTVSTLHSHGDNLDFAEVKDFHSFVFSVYLKPLLKDFPTRTWSANKDVKQKRMPVKSRFSIGILNWNYFNWRIKTCGATAFVCHKARVSDFARIEPLFATVQFWSRNESWTVIERF
jgi:hypothetical protein